MEDETNVDSELDTQNEELEANDTDNALDTEENATDAETGEVEDGDDNGSDAVTTARDRAKAHIDRLKEENKRLKSQLKGSGKESSSKEVASDLVQRTYLAANGFKEREVQEEIIRLSNKFGMSVDEALEDADIKMRAASLQKNIQARQASARPTGKGGITKRDAAWYVKNNILPDDAKLRVEVWNLLAQQERQ